MKYEPVFGDQSLFDGAPEDAEMAATVCQMPRWYTMFNGKVLFCDSKKESWRSADFNHPGSQLLAMRRIIKTPVWTMADKLAGRLPEVGCKAVQIQGFCEVDVLMIHNGCVVVCNSEISDSRPAVFKIDSFMELFTPIETQAEKAKRLEDEWVEKAYDDLLAHIGIHSTESPDFVKQNLHRVYNALLSGELQAPKGE